MCMNQCSSTITSMQKIKALTNSNSNYLGSCQQVEGNNKGCRPTLSLSLQKLDSLIRKYISLRFNFQTRSLSSSWIIDWYLLTNSSKLLLALGEWIENSQCDPVVSSINSQLLGPGFFVQSFLTFIYKILSSFSKEIIK